ncbi:MAG: SAM-dependent chlorinase/fluorinase [Firmicutes bacterium]|nr:SAM-dependent chlorinase/fluorinase [Bacillota bacterium]
MIAILTDFGQTEYVGIMKGVIMRLAPGLPVIDLYNEVRAQSVREGAWILYTAYRHFPEGTVFLAVVDPAVGTERQALAVRTRRYVFVGPDNGLLYPAVTDDGLQEVVSLDVPGSAAPTFHGRDVFAPAAARIAAGEPLTALGRPAEIRVPLAFYRRGREGEIVRVDRFGNIITNLPHTGKVTYQVAVEGYRRTLPFARTYAEGPRGHLFLVEGSAGTLEISLRNGSASSVMDVPVGSRIRIE